MVQLPNVIEGEFRFVGNQRSHPICDECQSVSWCARNGCIPVTDPVDEELADAISDLCNVKDEA